MARRIGFGLHGAGNLSWAAAVMTGIAAPVIVGALESSSPRAAQPVESLRFDVVSIRVNREISDRPTLMRPTLQPGGRVLMRNQTLRDLILTAYGVGENQSIGGPGWIRSIGFDLEARGPADMSPETARAMLRILLRERFSLVVHREQRELPIYVLTMAGRNGQAGPQLKPAAECAEATRPQDWPPGPPSSQVPILPPLDHVGPPPRCRSIFTGGHFSGRAVSMDVLAGELATVAGRRVVNRTGLDGEFDFDLSYTSELNVITPTDASTLPGLTTALQQQLGLKLQASRGPVEVLVIDRATMPTEN
jgi:uncharacterized protein (TIGR03435 family)